MGLLDRFRAQPRWKHTDPVVRAAAVEELPLDDQPLIASIAREDAAPSVRLAAIRKLVDPAVLAESARTDSDPDVREGAAQVLIETAAGAFEGTSEADSLASLASLVDQRHLGAVAKTATLDAVRRTALARIEDVKVLGSVARRSSHASTRIEALARIFDEVELVAVAIRGDFKDAAVSAVERLTSRDSLQAVSDRAKQKAAAKRARGRLREMDEATAASQRAVTPPPAALPAEAVPVTPEARAAQLCDSLETLARGGDWSAAPARLDAALSAWETIKAEAGDAAAQRFAEAARLVHLGIERNEAERAAEAERARQASEAAAAAELLIARVEGLGDEQLEAGLGEIKREWAALSVGQAGGPDRGAAIAQRFERVWAEADRRRRQLAETRTRAERASEMAAAFEQFAGESDLAAIRPRLAGLRKAWAQLVTAGPVDEAAMSRVTAAESRLAVAEGALREARERQQHENAERIGRLCQACESLAAAESPALKDVERVLRDVRAVAEDLGPLPSHDERDRLAARLSAAENALMPRARELRELDEWQRWANAGLQDELCRQAEALAETPDVDPAEAARQLAELQARWKDVAAGPREGGQALWQRFRVATEKIRAQCDVFFAEQATERAANLARKETLCQQVEALAESTDWLRTAEEIKRLQAEWKAVGHVSRGHEKAVWDRFRAACDRFFTRRHEDLLHRKEAWAVNAAKKEELCARAEALAESTEWDQAASELKRLQAEWKAVGPVRKTRSEALWLRFRAACDKFFDRYQHRNTVQIGGLLTEREAVCAQIEALMPPEDAPADIPPPDDLVGKVSNAWAEWQKVSAKSGVPRQAAEEVELRFTNALGALLGRFPEGFAGSEFDVETNRQKMEALCGKVEELVAEQAAPAVDSSGSVTLLAQQLREALASNSITGRVAADGGAKLRQTGEEIRKAQSAWKRVGPVPREMAAPLEARFQRACDRLFQQRDPRRVPPGSSR